MVLKDTLKNTKEQRLEAAPSNGLLGLFER